MNANEHFLSRRDFICTGAAAAIAAPMLAHAAEKEEKDLYRGLKFGVHTYSLRKFPLDKAIAMTRELGVRYFSINPIHLAIKSSPEQIAEARKKIADGGLILLEAGVIGMKNDVNETRRAFEYAKALGLKTIVCNPSLDCFDMLDKLLKEYDVRLAIHNHGPEGTYKVPDDVLGAIKDHDRRIGACVDIGHYERAGVKAGDALRALKGRILDVHFKDVDKREAKGKTVVAGAGIIDFQDAFKFLLETKYADGVMLEYEADADNPMPGMRKSLEFARAALAKM